MVAWFREAAEDSVERVVVAGGGTTSPLLKQNLNRYCEITGERHGVFCRQEAINLIACTTEFQRLFWQG